MNTTKKIIIAVIITTIIITVVIASSLLFTVSYDGVSTGLVNSPNETSQFSNSEIKIYNISGAEYKYDPNIIVAKSGEKIKINFTNKGNSPHNMIIKGFEDYAITTDPEKTSFIEFTAPSRGNYEFYCSIDDHVEKGMKGILKIE